MQICSSDLLAGDTIMNEPSKNLKTPPCSWHGLLLGSCPNHISNVLEIARNVSDSGWLTETLLKIQLVSSIKTCGKRNWLSKRIGTMFWH